MQDLIEQLKTKFDLDDAKAGEILETVLSTVREKLPAPIADKLDGMLNGEGLDLDSLKDQATGMLGNLFNK